MCCSASESGGEGTPLEGVGSSGSCRSVSSGGSDGTFSGGGGSSSAQLDSEPWYSPLSNLIHLGNYRVLAGHLEPPEAFSSDYVRSLFSWSDSFSGSCSSSAGCLELLRRVDSRYVRQGDFLSAALALTELSSSLRNSVCFYLYLEMLLMSGRVEQALSVSGEFLVHFPHDCWGSWYRGITLCLSGHDQELSCLCGTLRQLVVGPKLSAQSWCFGDVEVGEVLSWLERFSGVSGSASSSCVSSGGACTYDHLVGLRLCEEDLLVLGGKYVESGRYEDALTVYSYVLSANGDSMEALICRGDLLYFLGRDSEAFSDYRSVVSLDQRSGAGHWALGEFLRDLGQSQAALSEFTQMIGCCECVDCLWHRGAYYDELGEYELALRDYDRAVELEPWSWEVYLRRFEFYERHHKYSQAVKDYCLYVLKTGDSSELHLLSDCFSWAQIERHGEGESCRRILEDYVVTLTEMSSREDVPGHVYRARGFLLHLLDRDLEALADYDRAVVVPGCRDFAYVERGWLLEALGRHEEAERSFNLSLVYSGAGKFKVCYLERARFYRRRHRYAAAYYNYSLAMLSEPIGDVVSMVECGETSVCQGKVVRALHEFERVVALHGHDVRSYWGRGWCRHLLGDDTGALSDYNHGVELNPACGETYYRRGLFLREVGRVELAMQDFSRCASLDPSHGSNFSKRNLLRSLDPGSSHCSVYFGLEDRRLGYRRGRRLSHLESGAYRVFL